MLIDDMFVNIMKTNASISQSLIKEGRFINCSLRSTNWIRSKSSSISVILFAFFIVVELISMEQQAFWSFSRITPVKIIHKSVAIIFRGE